MASFAAQPSTTALRAGLGAEILGEFFTYRVGFGFAVAAFEVGDDAFERVRSLYDVAAVVQIAEVDIFLAAATQNIFLLLGG